jgi:hypothetical protein
VREEAKGLFHRPRRRPRFHDSRTRTATLRTRTITMFQPCFPSGRRSVDPLNPITLQIGGDSRDESSLDKVLRRSVDDNAWDEESDEVWRGMDRSSRYGRALWPRETESRQGARRSCPLSHARGDSRVRVGVRVREDHSGRRSVLLHVLVHSDLLNHKRSAIGMTGGETWIASMLRQLSKAVRADI